MPSRDRKKREAKKAACQKWRAENASTFACSQKAWREKNLEKTAFIAKSWRQKNREKNALMAKCWREKNPEKTAFIAKSWQQKNPEKTALMAKCWRQKNPEKAAFIAKSWQQKNPEKTALVAKHWRRKNQEKVARIKRRWRQQNAVKFRSSLLRWYQKNSVRKRTYRRRLYRKQMLEEQKLIRRQRYRVSLALESQYYRNKSIALLRAGEAAAEMAFVRKVAKSMKFITKKPRDAKMMHEAKVLVAAALNIRLKCMMGLKRAVGRLKSQCDGFKEKATDENPATLESLCGTGLHCRSREPFFYDFAYRVHSDKAAAIALPCEQTAEKEKYWPCDPNKCVMPENAPARLLDLCKAMSELSKIRRYMANADRCVHCKHAQKNDAPSAQQVGRGTGDPFTNTVKCKGGHPISCLPHECKSDLLFLRQLGVHYQSAYSLLRQFYEVSAYDRRLHGIDAALIKGDHKKLIAIVAAGADKGLDVAQKPVENVTPTVETPEEKIKSLKYAKEFFKEISEKPTLCCASCRMLHYRKDVRLVRFQQGANGEVKVFVGKDSNRKNAEKLFNALWQQLLEFIRKRERDEQNVFVCRPCFAALTEGAKHSPMSIFNQLEVQKLPEELACLNEFEKHFIQKAKPFQVVYRLGTVGSKLPESDRVKAQKGQVVHYPLPISETLRTLPDAKSMPAEQNLFIVVYGQPTKRRTEKEKQKIWKQLVNVNKVKTAVQQLKRINPEYGDVDDSWEPSNAVVAQEGDECVDEALQACEDIAKRPMIRKIDKNEEAAIIESYTVRPLFQSKPKESDLELYQMERVVAERIDAREAKLDLWCFPHLYPEGKNGECEKRDQPLPNNAFIRSRLYNEDPRFRHDHQYLFYLLHKYNLRAIANAVSQTLRNTTQYQNVPVGELLRRMAAGEQALEGNLFTMFRQVRGSAEYWSSRRLELRAMVRELGPPTWFLTLSAAEYDWEDMREVLISVNKDVEGVKEMRNGQRCAMDPVYTVKHFHRRFLAFLNKVLMAKGGGPLGEVVDYFWRVEYQSRGAPHYHMVLWVKDAPRIGVDAPEEVLEFIQKYATCRLPDKDKEPLLHKYVTRYQMHRVCNNYCKRTVRYKGKFSTRCRFGFPRKATDVAVLHDPLKTCGQRSKGRTQSRLYELPRTKAEDRINDYNAQTLLMWGANMDVQFIGENTVSVVNYIVSYLTKKETSALQELWDSVRQDASVWKRLFNFGCRSISMRECGAYEAADTIVGQNLYGKTRNSVWICARKPSLRPRQLKTYSKLKEMHERNPENAGDIFENNWISTYYPDRPDSLEDMCLYDFRRLHDRSPEWREGPMAFKSPANGTLKPRSKPYLVNHPQYVYMEKKEEYCYCLLLLFKPFRNESEELIDSATSSCIPIFERELESRKNPRLAAYHEQRQQEHQQAEANRRIIEEERNRLTQGSQHSNSDEPADYHVLGEPIEAANAMQELHVAMQQMAGETLEGNLEKMNADQRRIFDDITGHLRDKPDQQLLKFISGAGGTGKSFLINTLKLWAKGFYNIEGTTIAVAAPTGLAAYNVNGVTLHRLLQLPVQHKSKSCYVPLSDEVRKELKQNLKHIKLLVIDEISMVSNLMLTFAHLRLNEVFGSQEHTKFGGLNLIVLGDLAQLTPVSDKPAFCPLSSNVVHNAIGGTCEANLWTDVFGYDELTISMRQKDDPLFADILNRLRFGQSTDDDVTRLQSQLIEVPANVAPLQAFANKYKGLRDAGDEVVCLMSKSDMVKEFNAYMLGTEGRDVIEITAQDTFEYKGRPASKKQATNAEKMLRKRDEAVTETAGIEATVRLCVNARVMLRRNIDVQSGLVNGAIGSIVGIRLVNGRVADALNIKFDNAPEVQELKRSKVKFKLTDQIYVVREQFPVILSYAMTIHKSQGLSLSQVVVDAGNAIFNEGMTYVALSRVRTLAGLHLMNFDPSRANANQECMKEINRLRSACTPTIPLLAIERKKLPLVADRPWYNQPAKSGQPAKAPATKSRKRKAANSIEIEAPIAKKSKLAPPKVAELRWPKFDNQRSKVACYSNSAMQALFALKNFEEACAVFADEPCKVKQEIFKLLQQYHSRKIEGGQRLYTASVRNALGAPFRNSDGQQCAFEFIRKLRDALGLQHLFRIIINRVFRCLKCGKENCVADFADCVQIAMTDSLDFYDMLCQWKPVEGRKCPGCDADDASQSYDKVAQTKDQLLLYLSRHSGGEDNVADNRPISYFDPEDVYIGGTTFKVAAAILYYGNVEQGHYTAAVRSQYGWLNCDDHSISVMESFPSDLRNVSTLLLEKSQTEENLNAPMRQS